MRVRLDVPLVGPSSVEDLLVAVVVCFADGDTDVRMSGDYE